MTWCSVDKPADSIFNMHMDTAVPVKYLRLPIQDAYKVS